MEEYILFSDRVQIAEGYEKWLAEIPEAKDCPLNVVNYIYSIGRLKKVPTEPFGVSHEEAIENIKRIINNRNPNEELWRYKANQ